MAQAQQTRKPKDDKPVTVRFRVGADIGPNRYEKGDTAPASVFSAATCAAWLDQGLIEKVDD